MSIELFSTLSKLNYKEFLKFEKFIKNEYFNQQKAVLPLFKTLKKEFIPDKKYNALIKEIDDYNSEQRIEDNLKSDNKDKVKEPLSRFNNEFMKEFIKNDFKNSTVRGTSAKLIKVLEKYLAQKRFEKHKDIYPCILIDELHDRDMEKTLYRNINKFTRELDSFKCYHQTEFYSRFEISLIKFEHEHLWKSHSKKTEVAEKQVIAITLNNFFLLYYYSICSSLIINLITYCEDTHEEFEGHSQYHLYLYLKDYVKGITEQENFSPFYKDILKMYELKVDLKLNQFPPEDKFTKEKRTTNPKLNQYHSNESKKVKMNDEEFFNCFAEYERILYKVVNDLEKDELYNAFTVFQYLFPRIKEKKELHEKELLFYDLYFEKEAYKNSGRNYITLRGFWHFVVRGHSVLTHKRYEWSNSLLMNQIKALEPKHRSVIRNMGKARFLVETGRFNEALSILSKVKIFHDPIMKREYYMLNSMSYFEEGTIDKAESNIKSLKDFFKNEKKPELNHVQFEKFIAIIAELVYIKDRLGLKQSEFSNYYLDLSRLLEKVEEYKNLPQKEWFIKQLKGLMHSIPKKYKK
jgi:hypothetical protein